jgi:ribosome recycling factor
MIESIKKDARQRMVKSIEALKQSFGKVTDGRIPVCWIT